MPSISRSFFASTPTDNPDSNEQLEYLKEIYRQHLHTNSTEPEKYGEKAFVKNGEIYIAAGEEDSLSHELAHIYQQKTQNIPATDEIDGQKINTDPKLEKQADEIAQNIDAYIPKIVSPGFKGNDVMQFAHHEYGKFNRIKAKSEKLGLSFNLAKQILTQAQAEEQLTKTLLEIKGENNIENNLYLELEKNKKNSHIIDIINMLSEEKILKTNEFKYPFGNVFYTLHQTMLLLNDEKKKKVSDNILILTSCCDAEGVKSVLQSAGQNNTITLICPDANDFYDDNEENSDIRKQKSIETQKRLLNYFVNRLELMTQYVKSIYDRLKGKYWIRSTGSDPHQNAQHALFLVNKRTEKIDCVYKPHDMSPDATVIGQNGVLAEINKIFKKEKTLKQTILSGANAFSTMNIDIKDHMEEFIKKKNEMTQKEAEKYFFHAGMLKVITDAMAVIDLHADNIMPTKGGPMIIDAEIDFFQYINSGLEDALGRDEINLKETNSRFLIAKGREGKENIESGKAFSDRNSVYYQQYIKGYNLMVEQMKKNKDTFANIYKTQLQRVGKVRILPLGTDVLVRKLNDNMWEISEEENIKRINGLTDDIKKELCEEAKVDKSTYEFISSASNNMKVNIDEDKLKNAISETFKNGTIIAMYADIDGKIYLDDIQIGQIVQCNNNKPITKDMMIETMEKHFLYVVDNLKTRN